MRACILSMQRVPNMGSLLQSYSLKKLIESLDNEVSFIDIEKDDDDNALLQGMNQDFPEEREGEKSLITSLKKINKYTFNRIRNKRLLRNQDAEFEKFRKNFLGIKGNENNNQYDVCVIGSDEVFNALAHTEWGFTCQLFGNVHQANKVITYAASCGATSLDKVPSEVRNRISEAFKRISAFSVRDKNTEEFVLNMAESPVTISLDPVMVGDFSREIQLYGSKVILPKKFCIVYSYRNRIHDKSEIQTITNFCKKNNLEIVAVGAPQMWIKRFAILSPFEALYAFSQAEYVITDTFHGTIFSVRYAKRFATILRPSNRNKLLDLIQRIGIEDHMVEHLNQIYDIYKLEHDKEKINAQVEIERAKTLAYLKKSL